MGLAAFGIYLAVRKARERAVQRNLGLEEQDGFYVRPDAFYHPGHTWVVPEEDGTVRVGLDDFGRRLVEGIRRVVLPTKGAKLETGTAAVELDCGKKHARLVSPVDGVVTAINSKLARGGGSSLERDPYGKGWLFSVRVSDQGFTKLPTGRAAMEWLKGEADRLAFFFNRELGMTAADGGELIAQPPRLLNEEQWESLVETFFASSKGSAGQAARGEAR